MQDQLLDGGMWVGTELFSGSFGQLYTQNDVNNIVSCCLELDINQVDTAECYGDAPPVESLLGKAMAENKEYHLSSDLSTFVLSARRAGQSIFLFSLIFRSTYPIQILLHQTKLLNEI